PPIPPVKTWILGTHVTKQKGGTHSSLRPPPVPRRDEVAPVVSRVPVIREGGRPGGYAWVFSKIIGATGRTVCLGGGQLIGYPLSLFMGFMVPEVITYMGYNGVGMFIGREFELLGALIFHFRG